MSWLDRVFVAFDVLVDAYGERVNKIEVVANTYLLSTGLPLEDEEHVDVMCAFCADLIALCLNVPGVGPIRVRIGVACGPTTAGVIGHSRRFYRVFGDTGEWFWSGLPVLLTRPFFSCVASTAVNMASRMMSTGLEGRVHLSPSVAAVLREPRSRDAEENATMPRLEIAFRGKTPVKGKGELETYWLVHPVLGIGGAPPAALTSRQSSPATALSMEGTAAYDASIASAPSELVR